MPTFSFMSRAQHFSVLSDPSRVKRMTTELTNKSFAYTNFAVCECFFFFFFSLYSTQKSHCNIKQDSKILLFPRTALTFYKIS